MDDHEPSTPTAPPAQPPPLSTGSLRLDWACGAGILAGEMVEVCGPEGSGKTALCLRICAEAQRAGGQAAWIDVDDGFDPGFARRLGVLSGGGGRAGCPALVVARPTDGDIALDMLCTLAAAGPRLIVLDSLTGLVSRREIDGAASRDEHAEEQMLSTALRVVAPRLARFGTSLILTRQTDAATGAPGAAYHQLGQRLARLAPGLRTSLILWLEAAPPVEAGQSDGLHAQARVIRPRSRRLGGNSIKNSPCLQRVDFDIMYKQGFIRTGEIFDLGIDTGSIVLREGRYFFRDHELGLGRAESLRTMARTTALTKQVEQAIRQQMLRKQSH